MITFGKYKGKEWSYVILFDPSYILWAYRNIDNFSLDTAIREELSRSPEKTIQEKQYEDYEADRHTKAHILENEAYDDEYDMDCFDVDSAGRFFGDS